MSLLTTGTDPEVRKQPKTQRTKLHKPSITDPASKKKKLETLNN
jgi:hypothetical protein